MRGTLGDRVRIEHMLDAIDLIRSFGPGFNVERFDSDAMLRSAVSMQLGINGEAANALSAELHAAFPSVPWRNIVGSRNRIIHDYFGLRTQVIAEIVVIHLPILEQELIRVLESLPEHPAT